VLSFGLPLPKESLMGSRLATYLPRFVVLAFVCLLGTAAAFASDTPLVQPVATQAVAPVKPQPLVVPDVLRQAFVFAKGTLEDDGFSFRVVGSVQGYAANTVASQNPAAGMRLVNTGAPTVTLTLARNPHYAQSGRPENASVYGGTAVRRWGLRRIAPKAKPIVRPASRPAAEAPAKPAKPAAKPAKPTTRPVVTHAKPAAPKRKTAKPALRRPPAFHVAGAPREPLDELPLATRARLLLRWISGHPAATSANQRHFAYQHAWVVTGARFGWWHGAQALRILIAVDRKVESLWGLGFRSEDVARQALSEVEARTR
jgi:hypothetical protein